MEKNLRRTQGLLEMGNLFRSSPFPALHSLSGCDGIRRRFLQCVPFNPAGFSQRLPFPADGLSFVRRKDSHGYRQEFERLSQRNPSDRKLHLEDETNGGLRSRLSARRLAHLGDALRRERRRGYLVMGTPGPREIIVDKEKRLCHTTMKIKTIVFNFHGDCT